MNQNLYDQVVGIADIAIQTAEYEKALKEVTKEQVQAQESLNEAKGIAKATRKRLAFGILYDVALFVFGMIMSFVVSVATFVYEFVLIRNYGFAAFKDGANIAFFVIVVAVFVVLIPTILQICAIAYLILDVVKNIKVSIALKKHKKNVAVLEVKFRNTRQILLDYQNKTASEMEFMPVAYRNSKAVSYIIGALKSEHADSLEDAMKLYDLAFAGEV